MENWARMADGLRLDIGGALGVGAGSDTEEAGTLSDGGKVETHWSPLLTQAPMLKPPDPPLTPPTEVLVYVRTANGNLFLALPLWMEECGWVRRGCTYDVLFRATIQTAPEERGVRSVGEPEWRLPAGKDTRCLGCVVVGQKKAGAASSSSCGPGKVLQNSVSEGGVVYLGAGEARRRRKRPRDLGRGGPRVCIDAWGVCKDSLPEGVKEEKQLCLRVSLGHAGIRHAAVPPPQCGEYWPLSSFTRSPTIAGIRLGSLTSTMKRRSPTLGAPWWDLDKVLALLVQQKGETTAQEPFMERKAARLLLTLVNIHEESGVNLVDLASERGRARVFASPEEEGQISDATVLARGARCMGEYYLLQACGNMCLYRECALRRSFLQRAPLAAIPSFMIPSWCWATWFHHRDQTDQGDWEDPTWPDPGSWVAAPETAPSLTGAVTRELLHLAQGKWE